MKDSIEVLAQIDIDDFVTNFVSSYSRDDIFNLIVKIDDEVEDWEFTKKLKEHFEKVINDCIDADELMEE